MWVTCGIISHSLRLDGLAASSCGPALSDHGGPLVESGEMGGGTSKEGMLMLGARLVEHGGFLAMPSVIIPMQRHCAPVADHSCLCSDGHEVEGPAIKYGGYAHPRRHVQVEPRASHSSVRRSMRL